MERGEEIDTYYEVTHVTSSGQEQLKTHLSYQPCATPSFFTNVDWHDITEGDLFCGSEAGEDGSKLQFPFIKWGYPASTGWLLDVICLLLYSNNVRMYSFFKGHPTLGATF